MINIDEQLLNANQQNDAAGKLKEEKRGSSSAKATEDKGGKKSGDEAEASGEPRFLRQRVQAARRTLDLKERAKEKLKEKVAAPAKQATNNLLRWAWGVLIPSFGLSLIYINIHVFLRMVLGEKLFCKLGEEWIPKQVSAAGGGAGESLSKSIGIVEVMALLFLDLMALLIISVAATLVVMIATWLGAGWWEKLEMFYGALKSLGWATIEALVSLFS